MRQILSLTKALSDESRLRLLMATRRGELCLCQLIELLGLAPSTVSKHMTILQQAGFVHRRQDGRWAFYRLADARAPENIRQAIDWVVTTLEASPEIERDDLEIDRIRNSALEELAECYRG